MSAERSTSAINSSAPPVMPSETVFKIIRAAPYGILTKHHGEVLQNLQCALVLWHLTEIIESDESFRVCNSPILFDDYRCGEYYDARLEIPDFHSADFDDSELKNAISVKASHGEKRLCTADPVRIYAELKPVDVTREENGWLYDFGENNTGVCRISVNARAGQKITLYHGEWLKDGKLCLDNIRFRQQSDTQKDFVQKKRIYLQRGRTDPYS